MRITGSFKTIALLGQPVWRSPLPGIVNSAFEAMELPYALLPFEIPPHRLKEALGSAKSLGLAGLAIARPHKEAAAGLLDSLGPTAKSVGSADVVSVEGGRTVGHNTDLWAFLRALQEETGRTLRGKRAVLVGAGATAKAIALAFLREGGAALTACNRTAERAKSMLAQLKAEFPNAKLSTVPFDHREFRLSLKGADLLANATPSTLDGSGEPLVLEQDLHPALVVFDALYSEATPLLLSAKRVGCAVVPGTRMLLWGAAYAIKQWTGQEPPREAMEEALSRHLGASAGKF